MYLGKSDQGYTAWINIHTQAGRIVFLYTILFWNECRERRTWAASESRLQWRGWESRGQNWWPSMMGGSSSDGKNAETEGEGESAEIVWCSFHPSGSVAIEGSTFYAAVNWAAERFEWLSSAVCMWSWKVEKFWRKKRTRSTSVWYFHFLMVWTIFDSVTGCYWQGWLLRGRSQTHFFRHNILQMLLSLKCSHSYNTWLCFILSFVSSSALNQTHPANWHDH